jgi:hypothetical protein
VNQRLRTREWSGVDYYAELGLTSDASRAAVDEAYRRRAKALHPDTNPDPTAEDRFKRLSVAYKVLRDPATRGAYDEFRFRVDAGLLYAAEPNRVRTGAPVTPWGATSRPPVRRRQRRPLPAGVRVGLGWVLIVAGVAAVLWALVGPLPSHTAGDTEIAVQITLGIMAAKLLACGVVAIKYPELKARWHREPEGAGTSGTGPGDRPSIASPA